MNPWRDVVDQSLLDPGLQLQSDLMALLQRCRDPDSESQGPVAIGFDAIEQGPGLPQIPGQDRPAPIDVGEIVARLAK